MADIVVAGAGMAVPVDIPGTNRSYTLHPPTFGELGDMAARAAATLAPNDAVFADALRDAVRASGLPEQEKADHLAAIDAFEDLSDAIEAFYAAYGADRTAWSDDARREFAELTRGHAAARRKRSRAEWAMRDIETLAELRQHQMEAGRREQAEIVALCLGRPVDWVSALPAGDVLTLHVRALALMKPSASAEKN